MPVEYIKLKSFQKHREKKIRLSPTVTTLIGPTEAGKSSFLRAFRLLALNQSPHGTFITFGRKYCRIEAGVDGRVVVRKKGKGINKYFLDGKKFQAIGTKVPEEVSNLLMMDESNFQKQLDPPFWFMESAGQIGKHLNEIVNLELIDASLKKVSKRLAAAKSELALVNKRISDVSDKIEKLAWVSDFEDRVDDLNAQHSRMLDMKTEIEVLSPLIESVRRASDRNQRAAVLVETTGRLLSLADNAKRLQDRIDTLSKVIQEIEYYEEIISRPIPDASHLESMYSKIETLESKRDELQTLITKVQNAEEALCQAKLCRTRWKGQLRKAMKGKKCPVCGKLM